MAEPQRAAEEEQRALDDRIDGIMEAHAGDWRAAMEVMLMAYDEITRSISYGMVRGRYWREE